MRTTQRTIDDYEQTVLEIIKQSWLAIAQDLGGGLEFEPPEAGLICADEARHMVQRHVDFRRAGVDSTFFDSAEDFDDYWKGLEPVIRVRMIADAINFDTYL